MLATKLYQPMGTGPNDKYLSARAAEDSLRRLRTDHLDLYQMHHVDRSTPWDEIWQAMEQLVREGKVTYVGSRDFAGSASAATGRPPARVPRRCNRRPTLRRLPLLHPAIAPPASCRGSRARWESSSRRPPAEASVKAVP